MRDRVRRLKALRETFTRNTGGMEPSVQAKSSEWFRGNTVQRMASQEEYCVTPRIALLFTLYLLETQSPVAHSANIS